MKAIVDEKDHTRPAHNSLNTDTPKTETEPATEAETADHRMNEVANKAAAKGLNRQRQDESGEIFSK